MYSTIKPFIEKGWHTVPLTGKLERLKDGSKTVPHFEKDWKEKYSSEFNTNESALGGAISGKKSNFIAIDCDNTITFELFKPHCVDAVFFESIGKGDKRCGTFIFNYDEELNTTFRFSGNDIALDFYSENGFIYLPTTANKTKAMHKDLNVTDIPIIVKTMIKQFKSLYDMSKIKVTEEKAKSVSSAMCLNPLVKQFVDSRKFLPGLFKIITPRDFRREPEYVKKGYLHPNNIPENRGSEYLSKVSAILGADISIDEELFCRAMTEINNLWDSPMDIKRLDATIIDPMISGNASINGIQIWQYDELWNIKRTIFSTKRQSSVEAGFDDQRDCYYVVDIANEVVKVFDRDNDVVAYLNTIAYNAPNKVEFKRAVPIINVTSNPSKEFGFHEGENDIRDFNSFIRTPELAILADPSFYKDFYNYPTNTIKFLETLIPEEEVRIYLLKFLKRKLTKFEYSPVIPYFLGVHGSGKDTFVEMLSRIMGNIAKPTVKEFLDQFNGWLMDPYFVHLDEYGNQLTTIKDREEALGKLKAYTGSPRFQVRHMRTTGYSAKHNATFIMTANKNPLMIEDGDRRVLFIETPTVLKNAYWVKDVVELRQAILEKELKDFCYYLATEIPLMSPAEYVDPPETANKNILIAKSMHPAAKIAFVLKNRMIDFLKDLADDFSIPLVKENLDNGRLYATSIEELYLAMTDQKGDVRALNKLIRNSNVLILPTTIKGEKAYYYDIFKSNPFVEDNEDE